VLPIETDRAARRSLAQLAKRDGDFSRACELWRYALGNSLQGYEAYEQLAIYHEHKARDPHQAREDQIAHCARTINPKATSVILGDQNSGGSLIKRPHSVQGTTADSRDRAD
jgi:hypothetical protein